MQNTCSFDLNCYRPHPKDEEGNVFTGVCLPQGSTQALVLCPFQAGTPVSGPKSFPGGVPQDRETLQTGQGCPRIAQGYPPNRTVVPPRQDMDTIQPPPPPHTHTEHMYPFPAHESECLLRGGPYISCSHAGGLSC